VSVQQRFNAPVGRGCVLKSPIMPEIEKGLMMNRCAVAGLTSIGMVFRRGVDLLERAHETHWTARDLGASGVGVVFAGAGDCRLNQRGGERREDHHREHRHRPCAFAVVAPAAEEHRKRETIMIAAASVAAIELVRMSRCLTCDSSWPNTPESSSSLSICRMPCVAATAALLRAPAGRKKRSATHQE